MIMSNEEVNGLLPKTKIVGYENVNGVTYARTDWNTITETFPEKLIIFRNTDVVDDDREFLCTVLSVSDYCDSNAALLNWINKGLHVSFLRTANSLFTGLLC